MYQIIPPKTEDENILNQYHEQVTLPLSALAVFFRCLINTRQLLI